jgi:peptidyl-prolyl cis-trans isomerase C
MRNRFIIVISSLSVSIVFLGGCQLAQDRFAELVECLETITRGTGSPVLARVGRATVTTSDVRPRLSVLKAAYRNQPIPPEVRRPILDSLINEKIMAVAAHRSGMDRDEVFQSRLATLKADLLRNTILASLEKVTDDEIRQYYNQHKTQFEDRTSVSASRIQLKTLTDAKKAQALLKSGKPFSAVAKAMSVDQATAPGGGRIPPAIMLSAGPDLAKALASLRKGEISGIRKTGPGYELLKKDDEIIVPAQTIETAKPLIKSLLENQKIAQWIANERKSIPVAIDERAWESLNLPSSVTP